MPWICNGVRVWVCHACGWMWPVCNETIWPVRCAACRSRLWKQGRDS